MRPRRITLCSIGPYGGRETVDLDELAADGLFLIHGRIGAGKTFLLDAISFALFGEVPGDRTVATLRSQFAPADAEPRVELEFDAQGEQWLVERVPAHTRAKQRGSGEVDKPGGAQLSRRVGGRWEPVASGIREVSSKVHDLVGLSARQFSQVILLPQGRFEKVLRAGSDERESLLKTLFDTELFEAVSDHLDRRARAGSSALAHTTDRLVELRTRVVARWSEVVDDYGPGAAHAAAGAGAADPATMDQEQLDGLRDALTRRADEARRVAERAARRQRTAAEAHDEREQLAARWRRARELSAEAAELDARRHAVDELAAEVDRAMAAEGLRGGLEAVHGAELELRRRDDELAGAAGRAAAARTHCPVPLPDTVRLTELDGAALIDGDDAATAVGAARDAAMERLATLRSLDEVASRAEQLTDEADDAATVAVARRNEADRSGAEIDRLDEAVDTARARLEDARVAGARIDGLAERSRLLATRVAAARALGAARREVDDAGRAHLDADRSLQDLRATLNDHREAYLAGIAAELAGQLHDGESCAVCGSLEHPSPAQIHGATVSRAELDRTEELVERARAAERHAAEALAGATAELRRTEDTAGGSDADPVALGEEARTVSAELDAAREAAARVDALTRAVSDAAQRRSALDASRAEAARAASEAAQISTERRRLAEECHAQLHRELGDGVRLVDAVRSVDRLAGRLAEVLDSLVERQIARARLDDAVARRDSAVAASPFDDLDAVTDALLPDSERARRARLVEEHRRRAEQVATLLEAPELADLPDDPPDTEATLARLTLASEVATATAKHQALLDAARVAVTGWTEEHRRLTEAAADQTRHVELLAEVADHCAGRRGDKVSLQRWVLASYLTEICDLANQRLHTMSSGRYSLHVQPTASRGNQKSGLDLAVQDAFTGERRPVQSLSGGETFQASLALALAVAESVEAHAGGVHLDALFIDEGFGSLDPDSLELAMDELDRLRAGGRMVGIISHVGALRERIGVGISVRSGPTGSTLHVGELDPA